MGSAVSSMSSLRNTMSIKTVALISLCVHLTVLTIVLHLSRIRRAPGAPSYKASSAVILTESGKMFASLVLALRDLRREEKQDYQLLFESENDGGAAGDEDDQETLVDKESGNGSFGSQGASSLARTLLTECLGDGYLKLAIPALLFTIQNNLQYVASSNLSVPTFQITYQLKIPFTALCSVLLLGRVLSRKQWGSIALLSMGVAIVQLSVQSATVTHHPDGHTNHPENGTVKSPIAAAAAKLLRRDDPGEANMNQLLGLAAVLISCLCSGFACVYFEKQLKKPAAPAVALEDTEQGQKGLPAKPSRPTNLWVKNIQLSFFSLIVGTFIYVLETVSSSGDNVAFFTGFTGLAWVVVALQIGGGLLAALVIKHADNIAKVFATSSSIILSFIASIFLFDYHLTIGAVIGGSAVVGSTYMFAMAEQQPPSKSNTLDVEQRPVPMAPISRTPPLEDAELDKAIDDLERDEPAKY